MAGKAASFSSVLPLVIEKIFKNVLDINSPFRIPVNEGTNSRLEWTKYSDLYEIVHPSLVFMSLCLLPGA